MLPVVILVGVGLVVLLAQRKDRTLPLSNGGAHAEVMNAGEIVYNKIHTRVPMENWAALHADDQAAIQELVHEAMITIHSGRESLRDVGAAIAGPLVRLGLPMDPAAFVDYSHDQNLQNNVVADVRHTLATLTGSV